VNASPPSAAPKLARQATAREFLAVMFRRKWIILGLFLITTATVITVALTTPTSYQSAGRILIKRGERQSVLRADRQIFGDWEQDLASEMQVMKSQPVVERARDLVAEQAKHEHTAYKFEPKRIDVEVVGKSDVIALGYTDLDPSTAQIACRSLMQAYVEYHRDKLTSDRPQHFFAGEIQALTTGIDSLSQARRIYTEQAGMPAPLSQTQAWLTQLSALENRRSDIAAEFAQAQSVEQAMRKMQSDPDMDLPTFDGVAFTNENALVSLKQRVLEQQARIAMLTETLRDDAQEVVAARQTLETLQGLLRKEVEQRVRLAASHTESMQARVNVLDGEIATLHQQLDTAPQSLNKVDEMDAQLVTMRGRLREVTARQDEAAITANTMADVNVVVLAPASIAEPVNPLDFVRLGLAPAFSLLIGIAIAFFIDGLDLTVRTANQAEEYLDLPVLASMGDRRRRHS
jgi:succinoglycan biosynthesis transport protein ExoP